MKNKPVYFYNRVLYATVFHSNRAQIKDYWGTEKNERLHIVAPYLEELGKITCNAQCVKAMVENVISEEIEEEQWLGLQVRGQKKKCNLIQNKLCRKPGHIKPDMLF